MLIPGEIRCPRKKLRRAATSMCRWGGLEAAGAGVSDDGEAVSVTVGAPAEGRALRIGALKWGVLQARCQTSRGGGAALGGPAAEELDGVGETRSRRGGAAVSAFCRTPCAFGSTPVPRVAASSTANGSLSLGRAAAAR